LRAATVTTLFRGAIRLRILLGARTRLGSWRRALLRSLARVLLALGCRRGLRSLRHLLRCALLARLSPFGLRRLRDARSRLARSTSCFGGLRPFLPLCIALGLSCRVVGHARRFGRPRPLRALSIAFDLRTTLGLSSDRRL
jgi:hypothetical protein